MKRSIRLLRTAAAVALAGACLAGSASALTYGAGTVTGDGLHLRAQASTGSAVLTTAAKGTDVAILSDEADGWYSVCLNGVVGYMSADYLSVSTQGEADLGTGTADTEGASLHMRAGPGSEYEALASIPAGTALELTGIDDGWYRTSYGGVEGYVCSDYVSLSGGGSDAGIVNTSGANLNLRAGPGSEYEKLAAIPAGTALTLTGGEGGWYKTSYGGVEGYVSGDYILVTDGDTSYDGTLGQQLTAYAQQFLGCPYVYGASGSKSFDCSGFTSYIFQHFGYTLNRTAAGQYSNGTPVDSSQLQPGDLLLWRAYGSSKTATHVGIYLGGGRYIHASSTKGYVTINEMSYGSNVRYLVGARRILH